LSLKNLKRRVAKLEALRRKNAIVPVILIHQGETKEKAMATYFQEHPEQREYDAILIIDCSQG
jgi:hypothetical protein